ncbi:MAG: AbrB/MazE/SpoVT family DNA-binding domain-containing protein [Clostridia bacterium]|nr:AbrB/MazE/SpoVT family DNA-binding domain-containing protein [Clostridia bacterium]
MKATGIVRRIDDLGRVVIPKEIRRTMRIREGDPLEIYTDREGEVIFKKYSPIGELASFASQYVDTLNKICAMSVVITDRDVVISSAGVSKKEYNDKKLSEEYESIMDGRSLYHFKGTKINVCDGASGYVKYAMPIISEGDVIGSVACVTNDEGVSIDMHSTEAKLIQTAASFLGRQFEG